MKKLTKTEIKKLISEQVKHDGDLEALVAIVGPFLAATIGATYPPKILRRRLGFISKGVRGIMLSRMMKMAENLDSTIMKHTPEDDPWK